MILGYFADFNTDTVTSALVKCIQHGEFHHLQLADVQSTINHKVSAVNFLLCKTDNAYLRQQLETEIAQELDNLHDEEAKKKTLKTKLLFIQEEQDTKEAVVALSANLMKFITFAIEDTTGAQLYQCIKRYLDILLSEHGKKIFDCQLSRYPHLTYGIVNNIHHFVANHYKIMMKNPVWTRLLRNNIPIPAKSSPGDPAPGV